ncbi:MAG: solute carrier family 23 protein [Thermodesulfobacteriota bacterium]|nr:solute carrier family 23 protein [Thermodesulfobacteriota bacterium]
MAPQSNLVYKLNDIPPLGPLFMLSVQQMMLMFTAATFPALIVREVGGSMETASTIVSITMIAAGLGSILQALRNRWIGSGYLCPNVCGPSYLTVSLQAAWMGGFPLMRGMIIFAGLLEMLFANAIRRLRFLFPPVVVGLVVAFVGINVISVSITNFFGQVYAGDSLRWQKMVIAAISLFTMLGCSLWGSPALKLYCLLCGIATGWLAAALLTPEILSALEQVHAQPFFSIPFLDVDLLDLSFSWEMVLPFFIISICSTLKSFGNILAAQKISEPERDGVDMAPIAKGVLADGLTTLAAGAMGGLAVDTSASNVGLAAATRSVSRWIAITAGIIFTILGFFPKLSTMIATIPRPVVGASLVFAVSLMISAGLKEMFSEPLDQRKSFVLGLSCIFGLSTEFVPTLFAHLPTFIQPLFGSPLATTTVFAILLYQLFHLDQVFGKTKGA